MKTEKRKRKRNLLKDHRDNNREKLWIDSRSQLNKATGLRGLILAVLKIDGIKHLKINKQANLKCFPHLDITVTLNLTDHPVQSTSI